MANERTAEWRKRSENGPGAFAGTVGGVDGVKTTLGSVIDQLMRLQNGIEEGTPSEGRGAGTESPPNSELGASTNTLAKRPSRTDLKAPRERRPSTLAAGGRPDLSLISEGSGLEEDEDEGDRQTGVLQGSVSLITLNSFVAHNWCAGSEDPCRLRHPRPCNLSHTSISPVGPPVVKAAS